MAERRLKRPRDPIQLAKLIGDIATGTVVDVQLEGKAKTRARAGGLVGGPARAKSLTASRRREIAQKAAKSRWGPASKQSDAAPNRRRSR